LPILEAVIKEERFRDAVAFRVDFDTQKKFLRDHRVRWQSTLIVFKGEVERGRSVADLNPDSIAQLFARGL